MLAGLFEAIRALTFLALYRKGRLLEPEEQVYFLVSFPIVGLFFGVISFFIVHFLYESLPIFTSWFIPVLWLVLSGGKHLGELYRCSNAFMYSGKLEKKINLLEHNTLVLRGIGVVLIVFTGKIFAIMQAQTLDVRFISLTVLLIPMFSRYVAALLGLNLDGTVENVSSSTRKKWGRIVLLSSLIVIAASVFVYALGLLLVVTVMCLAVLSQLLVSRQFGIMKMSVIGWVVEVSELVMLWVVVISGVLGVNLAL